jgi:RNA polymerase sigma-70 factor (ECF subfamily)
MSAEMMNTTEQVMPEQHTALVVELVETGWVDRMVNIAGSQRGYPIDDRADVAQELAIRIWQHPEYSDGETYRGGVTIAGRIMIDEFRKAACRPQQAAAYPQADELLNGAADKVTTIAPMPDFSETVTNQHVVTAAVRQLPEDMRDVIARCYYQDKSVAQTAEELGIPEGTVKNRLFRARKAMRDLLARQGVHDLSDL